MTDKIFVGSGKIVKTKYRDLTKIRLSEQDLEKIKDNLDNGWINLNLKEKKTKVEGKPTHYLEVDTWKPDTNRGENSKESNKIDVDDLPF